MQPGSLTAFILTLVLSQPLAGIRKRGSIPYLYGLHKSCSPEKPQPIAAKSQTALLSGLNRTGKYLELDSTFIINLMCHPDNFTGQLLL